MNNDKTYNDALGWARRLYKELLEIKRKTDAVVELDGFLERLEEGFPELKESEDEGVRKALLKLVSNDKNNGYTDFYKAEGITCDDAIAYLEKLKEFQFGYPGIYFYDGEKLHFQGNPVMEEKQKEQKPAEKQDYHGLTELERAIHRGFLCAGIENVPIEIIKGTAQECRLVQMKSAEWSEEDETHRVHLVGLLEEVQKWAEQDGMHHLCIARCEESLSWLKSLRPQPQWKPSEEQMKALLSKLPVVKGGGDKVQDILESLYDDLKKL